MTRPTALEAQSTNSPSAWPARSAPYFGPPPPDHFPWPGEAGRSVHGFSANLAAASCYLTEDKGWLRADQKPDKLAIPTQHE